MSPPSKALKVNEPKVIFEEINGDIIAIHFDTGTYYNLNGPAGWIWMALAHATPEEIIRFLQQNQPREKTERISAEVTSFLDELKKESLMVETDHVANSVGTLAPLSGSYCKPVLTRYEDMQQLLLADPIHDVGPAGWPEMKPVP
jgi:hypothetical protein